MKYRRHESRSRRLAAASAILLSGMAMSALPTLSWADGGAGQAKPDTTQARTSSGVDGLIEHLHEELKITSAQESLFQNLAAAMRENAETMSTLAQKRSKATQTMTAVDDLKSYAEISEAHADGARKMITAFQPLYDSMSDDQKKAADVEFRDHYATHHRGKS